MASDAATAHELYNKADMALYAEKNTGRNLIRIYNPEIDSETEKRWELYRT